MSSPVHRGACAQTRAGDDVYRGKKMSPPATFSNPYNHSPKIPQNSTHHPGPLLIHLPVRVASLSLDLLTNKRCPKRDAKSRFLSAMKAAISLTKMKVPTPRALTELCADCRIAAGRAVRRVTWRGHQIRESRQDVTDEFRLACWRKAELTGTRWGRSRRRS